MNPLRSLLLKLSRAQLALVIFGLAGNGLVCLTILKTKTLHNVTNYMLLNLAVADALVSFFGVLEATVMGPIRVGIGTAGYCTPAFIYSFSAYFSFAYFQKVSFAYSIFGLTLATFERYIGIIKPLHYFTFFTKTRLIIMLLFMWMTPFLTELYAPVFYINTYVADNCTVPSKDRYPNAVTTSVLRMIILFVSSTAIAFMYIRILINLKRGARHLENQGIQGPPQELHRAHKKVTQSLVLVIAAFFILILPGQIVRNVIVFNNYFDGGYTFTEVFSRSISILTSMNSAINPILYGFSYGKLRRACIAMLCPCARCKRSNQVAMALNDM